MKKNLSLLSVSLLFLFFTGCAEKRQVIAAYSLEANSPNAPIFIPYGAEPVAAEFVEYDEAGTPRDSRTGQILLRVDIEERTLVADAY